MLTRRTLLHGTLVVTARASLRPVEVALGQKPSTTQAQALQRGSQPSLPLPPDFVGLGYEMSSAATLGLLSVSNTPYLNLLQQLGPAGVLRVGGIVADYTSYVPDAEPRADKHSTVITRAALQQFAALLKELHWTAIWSVNFAQGTVEEAVAEARAVAEVLGPNLQAIEIGNEVENYARGTQPFRTPPYAYDTYRAEFAKWHAAIATAVPQVRFAGPDTASSVDWVERLAQDSRGDVQLLTTHYYRNGQQRGSAEQLSSPDPKLLNILARLQKASQKSGIPWRMCETSSFSGGGKPGVSDTLLGALWTLDFMLLLAQSGCAGVNMETGVNQLGFISSYSPIQDNGSGQNSAGAPYYGMLAFAAARAECSHVHPLAPLVSDAGLTAYALGSAQHITSVALVNRSFNEVPVSVGALGMQRNRMLRLTGPSGDSKAGITFAGAMVTQQGTWAPNAHEVSHGETVTVPAMSAVILRRS